mmetsp:Transcript_12031/g.25621  ORF Transcript_12031/g.25621 Transcript_12031/m.25621 type:complete len:356 (+) Transcript_12031:95-1162(+)
MAATLRRTNSRVGVVIAEDSSRSASDEMKMERKRSSMSRTMSSESDLDCEYVAPTKQSSVASQSRRKKFTRSISSVESANSPDGKAFLDKRVMTSLQEQFNAITMLPGLFYYIYFVLVGWMATAGEHGNSPFHEIGMSELVDTAQGVLDNEDGWIVENSGCMNSHAFPYLPAPPPLPVIAAAIGGLSHCPFSMLYHWKCATTLEPSQRITHWSRRLDHATIHIAGAFAAYATSGRVDYFLFNLVFNLDSALKHIEEEVRPRRNLVRIGMTILLYILPVLVYGHYALFLKFLAMFALAGWLFVQYPVAGWSHSLFHIVLTLLPILIFEMSMQLESCKLQASFAQKCASLNSSSVHL